MYIQQTVTIIYSEKLAGNFKGIFLKKISEIDCAQMEARMRRHVFLFHSLEYFMMDFE
jgi:hypothetical protein